MDLISRQAAIDAVETALYGFNIACVAVGALEDLPSAEPKTGKWIPVRSYEVFGGDEIMWEIREAMK